MCCYVCLHSNFFKPDLLSFSACITTLLRLPQWLTILKCICIEIFDNFFIGQYERPLETKKKASYHLLIPVSIPEI